MKNILYILFAVCLLTACSDDDNGNDGGQTQDYTSFIVTIDATANFSNCIAAYKENNEYVMIAALGELTKGTLSSEIKLRDNSITEIYIFSDYMGTIRFDDIYTLEKNKKNIVTVKNGTKGISVTDKMDPTQYPKTLIVVNL